MPGPRLEHLRRALQELGEGNEKTRYGEPKITGGGTAGSSYDEANKGSHEGQGQEQRERDTQVELKRDVEQKVVDQVDAGEGGEGDRRDNRWGMPLGGFQV